jgi:hypothetical protein
MGWGEAKLHLSLIRITCHYQENNGAESLCIKTLVFNIPRKHLKSVYKLHLSLLCMTVYSKISP